MVANSYRAKHAAAERKLGRALDRMRKNSSLKNRLAVGAALHALIELEKKAKK
jgi:hypothetical protein